MKKVLAFSVAIIFSSCTFFEGRRNGVEEEWTKDSLQIKRVIINGIVQSEISYQKDGIIKEGRALYYEGGSVAKAVHYKRDKLVGSHIEYQSNVSQVYISVMIPLAIPFFSAVTICQVIYYVKKAI